MLPPIGLLYTMMTTVHAQRFGYLRCFMLIAVLGSAPYVDAVAQNSEAGLTLAVQVCSRCHAVLRGEGVTPNPEPLPFSKVGRPLPFEDIANTPGVTEMALYVWLTTSHPTMPDIVLEKEQLRDVVAYILSLKKNRP